MGIAVALSKLGVATRLDEIIAQDANSHWLMKQ